MWRRVAGFVTLALVALLVGNALAQERADGVSQKNAAPLERAAELLEAARLQLLRGQYTEARREGSSALALVDRFRSPDAIRLGGAASLLLGRTYRARGEDLRAADLLGRAVMLGRVAEDEELVVQALAEWGAILSRTDPTAVSPLVAEMEARQEAVSSLPAADRARVHENVSTIRLRSGDLQAALDDASRALELVEQLGDELWVAGPSITLAEVRLAEGTPAQAEALSRRAIRALETSTGSAHPLIGRALVLVARAKVQLGQFSEAGVVYASALDALQRSHGDNHRVVAETMADAGLVAWRQGDLETAGHLLSEATEIEEQLILRRLSAASGREALAFLRSVEPTMNAQLSLQARRPTDAALRRRGFETVLRRKGRVLDLEASSLDAIRRDLGSALVPSVDELDGLRAAGDRAAEMEVVERRVNRIGQILTVAPDPPRADSVVSRLAADEVLVELIRFEAIEPTRPHGRGESRYGAFVVRSGRPIAWIDLGPADRIEREAREFREALQDDPTDPTRAIAGGRTFHDAIVEPLLADIGDARGLLVSPDGILNLIPFAAAIDRSGRYLLERYTISYLTSARDLLSPGAEADRAGPPVLIGAPDFGLAAPGSNIRRRTAPWADLPATRQEVMALGELLDVTPLTGAAASEAAVKRLKGPVALHIATHAFFEDENREASNPAEHLLRSGLVLAGANEEAAGAQDGILTALELAGVDLTGTRLVVLSACDTGVGSVENGEGVYGLRRALAIAGAESLITTLWKVADAPTQNLMREFYRRLLEGDSPAESLRAVQMSMLGDDVLRHPVFWASFIQVGPPSVVPLRVFSSVDRPLAGGRS